MATASSDSAKSVLCSRSLKSTTPRDAFFLSYKSVKASSSAKSASTAGFEASGTGNMKFALNGALTVGTYDGANIEIREAVGAENFYLFGLREEQIEEMHSKNTYNPRQLYDNSDYIKRILNTLNSNTFCDTLSVRYIIVLKKLPNL